MDETKTAPDVCEPLPTWTRGHHGRKLPLTVSLSADEIDFLKAQAMSRGTTVSTIVREIVESRLAELRNSKSDD